MQVTTRKCSTGEPEPYCIKGSTRAHRRQQQPRLLGLSMELRRRTMADFCWCLVSICMFWVSCLENISWNPCKLQLENVVQGSQSLAALKVLLRRRRQQPSLLGLSMELYRRWRHGATTGLLNQILFKFPNIILNLDCKVQAKLSHAGYNSKM